MKLENLLQSYKERMIILGMSQNELAKLTEISVGGISLILNGKCGSFQKLRLIEKALFEMQVKEKPRFSYKERIENLGKSQSHFARELGMTKQQFSAKILKPKYESAGFERLDNILEVYENEIIS